MKRFILCTACVFTIFICGCSSKDSETTAAATTAMAMTSPEIYDSADNYYSEAGGSYDTETQLSSGESLTETMSQAENLKIIKTVDISLSVDEFDSTMGKLRSLADSTGGFVQSSNEYLSAVIEERNYKSGQIVLRVRSEFYESARNEIGTYGTKTSEYERAENVTAEYIDTESRLDAKKVEYERIMSMYEKAETIEEIIVLEGKLTEIRTEIEMHTSRLNNIDRLTAYSTITVMLNEKLPNQTDEAIALEAEKQKFGSRISQSFSSSIDLFVKFMQGIVVVLAGLIVPLSAIGAVALVVYILIKRFGKKEKKENKENKENIENTEIKE